MKPQLPRPLPCLDTLIAIQKQQQQGVIRDARQLDLVPQETACPTTPCSLSSYTSSPSRPPSASPGP